MRNIIAVSLADFVDFVVTSGTPRLTKVRVLKSRGKYEPAFDFWKRLREGIVAFHKAKNGDTKILDRLASEQHDIKKRTAYVPLVKHYKKFLGRKKIDWFMPPADEWRSGKLTVRVNPELGLRIDGKRYAIKLYFKAEKLSKRRIDVALALMLEALDLPADTHCGILDIRRARLYSSEKSPDDLGPLLKGEASSLATIWNDLD